MTIDDFARSARAKLHALHEVPSLLVPGTTPSAVLLPIFFDAEVAHVWLVRKTDGLRVHSGQVALPGGKSEREDASLVETALREAREEIGLPSSLVEVLGAGDPVPTMTGFVITPFVGLLREPFQPVADQVEVAHAFSAPLHVFREEGTMREVTVRTWSREVPTYAIGDQIVWGATGHVLHTIAQLLT